MTLIPRKILQNKFNEIHNISDKHLEDYLASLDKNIPTTQALEECLEITKDACKDVPMTETFDPLDVALSGRRCYYSDLIQLGEKLGEDYYQKIINNDH